MSDPSRPFQQQIDEFEAKPREPLAPAEPNCQACEDKGTIMIGAACRVPCKYCDKGKTKRIAAAEKAVIEKAKAWIGADGSANASDRLVDALTELSEAEKLAG